MLSAEVPHTIRVRKKASLNLLSRECWSKEGGNAFICFFSHETFWGDERETFSGRSGNLESWCCDTNQAILFCCSCHLALILPLCRYEVIMALELCNESYLIKDDEISLQPVYQFHQLGVAGLEVMSNRVKHMQSLHFTCQPWPFSKGDCSENHVQHVLTPLLSLIPLLFLCQDKTDCAV